MGEEKKQENNEIMKEPVMTEKELVDIVNRQKNIYLGIFGAWLPKLLIIQLQPTL